MRLWLAREHVRSSLWGSVPRVEVCVACCNRPVGEGRGRERWEGGGREGERRRERDRDRLMRVWGEWGV